MPWRFVTPNGLTQSSDLGAGIAAFPSMPKMKTKKAAAKRFRRTAHGLKRSQANKSHRNTSLTQTRIRRLRGMTHVDPSDRKHVEELLAS